MKMQVTIPENLKTSRPTALLNVEIENTERGPEIVLTSLLGVEYDRISITRLYDHSETFQELLDHECPDCEEDHCDDGNCYRKGNERISNKIEELKHIFHQLENLLD